MLEIHGTSNNTRTELAQLKKWYPKTVNDKLRATHKVINVLQLVMHMQQYHIL